MKHDDYPWLFCASDEASRGAQKSYFRILATQLTLFFVVGLLGTILRLFSASFQKHLSGTMALLLAIAIIVTLISRERKFDKIWFDSRAVAESAKTAAWRFMMSAPPFQPQGAADIEPAFIGELDEIKKARSGIDEYLSGHAQSAKPISQFMQDLRAGDLANRKSVYLQDRVLDQKDWYGSKATWNRKQKALWYWIGLGLQIVALGLAIFSASYGPFPFNLVGVLMAAAASLAAWSQAKRHDDLSNSYSMAAQELQNIQTLIERTEDENSFRALVDQGEEAISREHTMWCARRSISIPPLKRK